MSQRPNSRPRCVWPMTGSESLCKASCQLFGWEKLTLFFNVDLLELRGFATISMECMAKAIGFILALVALVAGILCAVDPVTCIWRAGVAFFAGWLCATVWQGVFAATSR